MSAFPARSLTLPAFVSRRGLGALPVLRGLAVLCLFTQVACSGSDGDGAPSATGNTESAAGTGGSGTGGSGTGGSGTGGSSGSGEATGGSSTAARGGSASQTEARDESAAIDKTFRHHGFEVTLGTAQLTVLAGAKVGDLTIDSTMLNRSSESDHFNAQLLLTDGKKDYTMSTAGGFPSILGERSLAVPLTAAVDADFDLGAATLIVGNSANNQATVPIGEDSPDTFVSLMPEEVPFQGTLIAGAAQVTLTGGQVRADNVQQHDQVDAEHLYVWIRYTAELRADGAGSAGFGPSKFQLVTPEGNGLAGNDGDSVSLSQVGATAELSVRFTVPKPVVGTYELILAGDYLSGYKATSTSIELDVPELETFPE